MYFSPRKQSSRYLAYREQELTNLQDQLNKKVVTNQELLTARKHLHKLTTSYNHLASNQQSNNLKKVLGSSNDAVAQLLNQKKSFLKELEFRSKQIDEIDSIKENLQKKGLEAQENLQRTSSECSSLIAKKEDKDNQILQKQKQISQLRRSLQYERQIQTEIQEAQEQLKGKLKMAKENLKHTEKMIETQKQKITRQLQQINNLQHQIASQQLKMENLSLKLQNQQKVVQNYQHRYEIAQNRIQKNIQDKYYLINQSSTEQNIDKLIQSCINQRNQRKTECQNYTSAIQNLQTSIIQEQNRRIAFDQQFKQKKQSLEQLKQKNDSIREMLNEIFSQDSDVIKLISQKKVFQRTRQTGSSHNKQNIFKNASPGIGKIYRKQQSIFNSVPENKSYLISNLSKGLESMDTAEGFFSRNGSVF